MTTRLRVSPQAAIAAVKQSLRNAKQAASSNRLARMAFRSTLRTVNAIAPVRRRMAAQLGR